MAEFQIKTETRPERCEICHQSDCFDPDRNYCSRCAGVPVVKEETVVTRVAKAATITNIELGAFVGLTIGVAMGVFGGAIAFSVQGGVMGAIVGAMSLGPVWMVQGALIGLLVGRSARLTDAADITAVSKAINIPNTGSQIPEQIISSTFLFRTLKAAIIGLIIAMPIWFFFGEDIFYSVKTIIWAICGLANGVTIDLLCRNRSDRRKNPSYRISSEGEINE
jgi:hypothetical protein